MRSPGSRRRRGAIGRRGRRCWPRPRRAGRAAGALGCRAAPGPAYLHRLPGSACQACWRRPSRARPGPRGAPGRRERASPERPGGGRGAGRCAVCAARPWVSLPPHSSACAAAGQVLRRSSRRPGCSHLFSDWVEAKTVDAHPPMLCRVPSALRWVQTVDGVFTRISSQVDQGVSAVILFPI